MFEMPQELGPGVKKEQTVIPKHLKIAVNHGPMEEITAMATIELEDLEELVRIDSFSIMSNCQ